MKYRSFAVAMTCLTFAVNIFAGIVPGRWDKVAALESGTEVIVERGSGGRVVGRFRRLESQVLVLEDAAAGEMSIPRSDVRRVSKTEAEPDSVRNGVLLGLLLGAAGGGAAGAATASRATNEGRSGVAWSVGFASLGAGAGALVGFLGDSARHSDEVLLYQAVP